MNDAFYKKYLKEYKIKLERVIIQGLKPFKAVPMYIVYRTFGIKMPKGMKGKEITLGEFIRRTAGI